MSAPVPLMTGTALSHNSRILAFVDNPFSCAQANGNRSMSSALVGSVPGAFGMRCGHLRRYVASEGQDHVLPPPPRQPAPAQHHQPLGEIHLISRGFAGGGESSSTKKAHLRNIRLGEILEV